jgi:quaternary ammonium compound-resistance protein SugE
MSPWLLLIIAGILESFWLVSLKFLDMKKIATFEWIKFQDVQQSILTILPFLGYVTFGLANVICFSIASKKIPASVAFAVWVATALCISAVLDATYFDENLTWKHLVSFALIIIGMIGLKLSTT